MANPFVRVGGFFGRFFGNTIGESAAYGIGGAMQEPLRPLLQELANATWETATLAGIGKPLGPEVAAEVVAEDVEKHDWGVAQSQQAGFTAAEFEAVLGAVLNAPGLEQLYSLWRRGLINDAGFSHGLRKGKLETRWDAALKNAHDVLLSPGDLANARQQEFIDDARMHTEGGEQGVTPERMDLLFKLAGLPPGVETGLEMLRRGIITTAEFAELVATGHTKTRWTAQLEALRARVLGAETYAGLHLRGWIDEAAMVAGGDLTGYSKEQMDLLFKEHGRPATGHQVLVGLRRGGVYNGPLTGIPQPFVDAIRQSNIRPEWTNILWHAVVVYPPLFQLTRLVQAGVIDAATAADWSYKSGEAQEVVTTLEAYWAQGTAAKADTHAGKAQTQLWTTLHKSYLAGESTDSEVTAALPRAGVAAGSVADVLATWAEERTIIRKQLSPAQVRKALNDGIVNPATGAAWTVGDATAALLTRGYDQADATVFLQE